MRCKDHKGSWIFRLFIAITLSAAAVQTATANDPAESQRWRERARNVTITRDDWGIAHVIGKTDADAVFGMIYAQAEDDFNRVESNYLNSMGRLAEAEGESAIWRDLRMKIFIDPEELKANYAASPAWLKELMIAWADGLNFYLSAHPSVKPRVITRFEPWMALSFTEGSIGGDIETINLERLRAMYDNSGPAQASFEDEDDIFPPEPSGSNGIAIAPKNTTAGKALLLINPHTSFYFRSELQMASNEGLNAYGAVTWGQFFIYQGFNERLGWMHTSSAVDAIDEFLETITKKDQGYVYKFGGEQRPVVAKAIRIPYKTPTGMSERIVTVYRTHHGPIIRKTDTGQWVAISLMHKPVEALTQSYKRTKAKTYKEFKEIMDLHGNSSNATIYADADGNIAYFHPNYIPRRDDKFDWTRPVEGSDPATEYKGLLTTDESPNLFNPSSGWLYNSNNWPWSAAGPSSLKQKDYPRWVDSGTENARGLHAIKLLEGRKDFTLEKLQAAAYDSYLPWFEKPLPALIKAWDALPVNDPLKTKSAAQIEVLKKWDYRWSVDSVATSLAIFWAEDAMRQLGPAARAAGVPAAEFIATGAMPDRLVGSLAAAAEKLAADFGKWNTPWGEINRFQRLTGDIVQPFNDAAPSIPVGFTSGNWGSLASFGARPTRNTKKWYGTSGNSFVAVVEFGKTVRAKAVTAGGESGDPRSKHFNDQAGRYSTGDLRDVYFYPAHLKEHTARTYNPGK